MNESVAAPQSCGAELISDPQDPANYPHAASSLPSELYPTDAGSVGWHKIKPVQARTPQNYPTLFVYPH